MKNFQIRKYKFREKGFADCPFECDKSGELNNQEYILSSQEKIITGARQVCRNQLNPSENRETIYLCRGEKDYQNQLFTGLRGKNLHLN